MILWYGRNTMLMLLEMLLRLMLLLWLLVIMLLMLWVLLMLLLRHVVSGIRRVHRRGVPHSTSIGIGMTGWEVRRVPLAGMPTVLLREGGRWGVLERRRVIRRWWQSRRRGMLLIRSIVGGSGVGIVVLPAHACREGLRLTLRLLRGVDVVGHGL